MAAAEDGPLLRLVETDFHGRCRTSFFCFQCSAPMCAHCCSANHGNLHHGGGPAPALIETVRHAPCVRSMDARGCGYNTAGIQRFRSNREKWIPILRQEQEEQRFHRPCLQCDQVIDSSASYCSIACRAEDHPGNRFAMVEQLVEFAQNFNDPVVQLDRFCLICLKAFGSTSCPQHQAHHNAGQALADEQAQGDTVIRVRVIDGWAAVDEAQLPAHFVENVQVLQPEDGQNYYAVHRRGNLPVAVPVPNAAHPCQRQQCPEGFVGHAAFCSLCCRHVA